MTDPAPALILSEITKSFGGVRVLRSVDLESAPGGACAGRRERRRQEHAHEDRGRHPPARLGGWLSSHARSRLETRRCTARRHRDGAPGAQPGA